MRLYIIPAFAFALGAGLFSTPQAQARFSPAPLAAPSSVEEVACVTRRIRTVQPNGRVVVRNVRDCGVRARPRCRWVQERVRAPNGRWVVRNVQRCGGGRRW